MAFITTTFKLDLTPGASRQVIHASQGDIGRPFKAELYWNGTHFDADDYDAILRGKKVDATVFEYDTPVVDGYYVTFSTAEQMTIISGPVECELVFSNDGDIIASANFVLMVEDSPYNPDAPSESVIPGIEDLIEQTIGGDVSDEVDAWLDEHPEATTTVQDDSLTTAKYKDGSVTAEKLADGAVTPAKMANLSTDYKSNAGIVEQLNTLNSNIATTQTMDAEFMYLGGEFGTGKTDAQKETNTTALQALFNKYNAICFKCTREIETINFSIQVKTGSNFCNLFLYTYYSDSADGVFVCSSVARFMRLYNVSLSNQSTEYCKKAFVFGSLSGSSNVSAPYISLDAIEIVNFDYPLVLFTFNCSLGEIHINSCKYSAFIMGTSVNGGAIYSLNCQHGVMLGCYYDDNGSIVNTSNAYLFYSNIGIISHDGTISTNYVLGVGRVRGVKVGVLSYEITNNLLTNVINGYVPSSSYLVLILDNIYPQGSPTGKFYSNTTNNDGLQILIGSIFGEYMVDAFGNSDEFNGKILNNTYYLTRPDKNSLSSYALSSPVLVNGQSKKCAEFFSGKIGNVAGTPNTSDGFYTHGLFLGTLNKGEQINIELYSARSQQATFDRTFFMQARLLIGNNNTYNSNTYKANANATINFTTEYYTTGEDYNGNLLSDGLPPGFVASVDSSGPRPIIKIAGPTFEGNTPATYVFCLEVLGGYETVVSIVEN